MSKIKSIVSRIFLGFLCLLLVACKTEVNVDVYVSDAFLDDKISIPAIMKFEIPSCSSGAEYEVKILALFSDESAAKISECLEQGMDSFLVVSLAAEMASDQSARDLVIFREKIDESVRKGNKEYEVRGLKLSLNSAFLTRVNSMLAENFQSLTYEDVEIEIKINNDERAESLVTGYGLWVDGVPYQVYRQQTLKRREAVTLRLSDLSTDLILKQEMQSIAYVYRSIDD